MKREEPVEFNKNMFNPWSTGTILAEISNCVLIVPRGTKTAYETAGWKSLADGGYFKEVVETDDIDKYDMNGDGTLSVADVTTLVNVIVKKE